jgi:hypothetical protein
MASAYPIRTVICRGSAVPAAATSIRADAGAVSRPCRGPVVSAGHQAFLAAQDNLSQRSLFAIRQ